jgi:hypothetical protein
MGVTVIRLPFALMDTTATPPTHARLMATTVRPGLAAASLSVQARGTEADTMAMGTVASMAIAAGTATDTVAGTVTGAATVMAADIMVATPAAITAPQ